MGSDTNNTNTGRQKFLDFRSDYLEGAHPLILEALASTNYEKTGGYGSDDYCARAKEKIRKECRSPEADVFFLTGGTQTNAVVIGAFLRPYQGVIAADSGHISVHEAGAIEYGGHKVLAFPHREGKLTAEAIRLCITSYQADQNRDHVVTPGMVYISHPTEFGTLYTKSELAEISSICRENNILLFLDGARLGYGLVSEHTDLGLADIARYCDVFYIGGTKVGAMFGEALVISRQSAIPHFVSIMKQHGALLAKGRILGIQFDTLFTDNLYFDIARHAVSLARNLTLALKSKGYRFFVEPCTNQIFLIVSNSKLAEWEGKIGYAYWSEFDVDHKVIRLATSWATDPQDVEDLIGYL